DPSIEKISGRRWPDHHAQSRGCCVFSTTPRRKQRPKPVIGQDERMPSINRSYLALRRRRPPDANLASCLRGTVSSMSLTCFDCDQVLPLYWLKDAVWHSLRKQTDPPESQNKFCLCIGCA